MSGWSVTIARRPCTPPLPLEAFSENISASTGSSKEKRSGFEYEEALIMMSCWSLEPRGRPKFQDMVGMFSCLLERRESDYMHLQADFIVSLETNDYYCPHPTARYTQEQCTDDVGKRRANL